MKTMTRLTAAGTLVGLLLGAGVLTEAGPASAVVVTAESGAVNVLLDSHETYQASLSGYSATSPMCGSAINAALAQGVLFTDESRTACGNALAVCADDAYANGRALSGVKFYAYTYDYDCLVR